MEKEHPSPQGLQTYLKVHSVKNRSTVSIHSLMWRWSVENWTLCLARSSFHISFVGLWKTLQMAKKLGPIIFVQEITRFLFGKNISNLCQSIFVFLTVYYDIIFKHWLESSSIRLRVSFFIDFVSFSLNAKEQSQHPSLQGWQTSYLNLFPR